jgi:hypothetical protein
MALLGDLRAQLQAPPGHDISSPAAYFFAMVYRLSRLAWLAIRCRLRFLADRLINRSTSHSTVRLSQARYATVCYSQNARTASAEPRRALV